MRVGTRVRLSEKYISFFVRDVAARDTWRLAQGTVVAVEARFGKGPLIRVSWDEAMSELSLSTKLDTLWLDEVPESPKPAPKPVVEPADEAEDEPELLDDEIIPSTDPPPPTEDPVSGDGEDADIAEGDTTDDE